MTGWPRVRKRLTRAALALGLGLGLVLGLDRLFPPDLSRVAHTSTWVVDRDGKLLRAFTASDGAWRLAARPEAVDPLYLTMLLAYEDQRFPYHPGVDPLAAGRALMQWAREGRVVSGASTLTMQAARLLHPRRRRTLGAKLIEAARALQLEARLAKSDILSLYLTFAPFGGNLEGVRAASLAYFGKEPARLAAHEAALLVALPQSPETLRPDRFPARARAARDKVLRVMVRRGVLTALAAREASAAAVPRARRPLPFHAAHLARRLMAAGPRGGVRRTTIDGGLQRSIERLARIEHASLDRGASMAVLVVENKSRRVLAYLGSAGFFDSARAGQVDMVRALRSPGSALKPFIYGMAFDELLLHPDTIMQDAPRRFGEYRPENFRRVYRGEVTARQALQQSLNVPAVSVLERVGPGRFAARLREAGARLKFGGPRVEPGLPLALGGVGISLFDLTGLYVALANGGVAGKLILDPAAVPEPGRRMFGAAAAWRLARILEAAPPPVEFVAAAQTRRTRRVAYKTGTSYGFRDAWAAGYDSRYTVAVWVGRPDGTPSPDHYGRNTAAPILFRVFDLLPSALPAMPERPAGLTLADGAALPERLRRFDAARARPAGLGALQVAPLIVAFPPDGALVELDENAGAGRTLPLVAEGGRRPFIWLVNDRPVASRRGGRRASWVPDGEGFVRVTVIDADGRRASAEARLKK